jgi:hypothetical protein
MPACSNRGCPGPLPHAILPLAARRRWPCIRFVRPEAGKRVAQRGKLPARRKFYQRKAPGHASHGPQTADQLARLGPDDLLFALSQHAVEFAHARLQQQGLPWPSSRPGVNSISGKPQATRPMARRRLTSASPCGNGLSADRIYAWPGASRAGRRACPPRA